MLISVCMCTFKRPHLQKTLESINDLNLPDGVKLEIVVVDNDENNSAKSIVDNYSGLAVIKYISEPKKNISAARNKCLENSTGEWIAFIDDDEVAEKNWLLTLYQVAMNFKADAVFGKVVSIYPNNTPDWIIKGGYFDRVNRDTGERLTSGACNCTLVRQKAIGDEKFNLEYGLTGGEDADFFYRLHKNGAVLVFSNESIVFEEVERNRVNLTFLVNRKIRIGSSYSKYRMPDFSLLKKILYSLKSAALLIFYVFLFLISYMIKSEKKYRWILKGAERYGKLKYIFTKKIEELY